MAEDKDNNANERRLSDVVRERRIVAAEREDVVDDMKEADKARLQLLLEEIYPLISAIDAEDDRFDFSISSGEQPRFWIDSVTHVHMGRDRRTYRFVRDSRLGRVVLAEDGNMQLVADHIANYVADRIIEREKILEGDLEEFKDYYARMSGKDVGQDRRVKPATQSDELIAEKRPQAPSANMVIAIIWFIIGSVLGLAVAVSQYDAIIAFIQSF